MDEIYQSNAQPREGPTLEQLGSALGVPQGEVNGEDNLQGTALITHSDPSIQLEQH